jgi:hypothetical protein
VETSWPGAIATIVVVEQDVEPAPGLGIELASPPRGGVNMSIASWATVVCYAGASPGLAADGALNGHY